MIVTIILKDAPLPGNKNRVVFDVLETHDPADEFLTPVGFLGNSFKQTLGHIAEYEPGLIHAQEPA